MKSKYIVFNRAAKNGIDERRSAYLRSEAVVEDSVSGSCGLLSLGQDYGILKSRHKSAGSGEI